MTKQLIECRDFSSIVSKRTIWYTIVYLHMTLEKEAKDLHYSARTSKTGLLAISEGVNSVQ